MDNLIFRKAKIEDVFDMAELITKNLGTCDVKINDVKIKTNDEINYENLEHVKSNIHNYIVCAGREDKIIGMCGLSQILTKNHYGIKNLPQYREILYLVVDENYQKHGIGTKLLEMCSQNCDVPIIYEAWGPNSDQPVNSKKLLEKCGYVLFKDLGPEYYKSHGYCPYCCNRYKNCVSCKAEIWIKTQ